MDLDSLKKHIDFQSKYRIQKEGKRGFSFKIAKPSSFDDGRYAMRFLPGHPERCPKGYHIYATYSVETQPGTCVEVLCQPDNGPSYIDRLIEAMGNPSVSGSLPADLREWLARLRPTVRYLFPTIWYVHSREVDVLCSDGVPRKFPQYSPASMRETEPTPIIWDVRAVRLLESIVELHQDIPQLSDPEGGCYCAFKKSGSSYSLSALPPQKPLDKRAAKFLENEHYPNLVAWGRKIRMDDAQQAALIQNSWAARLLGKFINLAEL